MAERDELLKRWRQGFAELSMVSEAPAAKALDESVQITSSAKEGSEPIMAGVPLVDKHRERFGDWIRAQRDDPSYDADLAELHGLVGRLETDIGRMKFRAPSRVLESERERDQRCLDVYEGVHYADAAQREGCSPAWFRKLRKAHDRKPLNGLNSEKSVSVA